MKRPIHWRNLASDPSIGFDLLRAYLGVALFVRGAMFVAHPGRVAAFARQTGDWFVPYFTAHLVGIAHVGGGILLALGLATRLAAAVQVPILLGAVFWVHWGEGLLAAGQSLELAGLVLAMLIVFTVFGAGRLSVDYLLSSKRRTTRMSGPRYEQPSY
jgi:putative oxidoreductase